MMATINDGGQAFPLQDTYDGCGGGSQGQSGTSLRDWFAGQAIGAVIRQAASDLRTIPGKNPAKYFAGLAYEIADAMLSESDKG